MGAIGLNPIRLDRIGLDPIRINAIRLGVPGAASGSDRPYIDPEVLASLKAVCICYGKSNDDPDRAIVKNLVDPDNPFIISNAAYKLNSGYGKYDIDFTIFTNKFNVDSLDAFKVILDGGGSLFRPYSTLTENYPSWKGKVTFNNSNFTGTLTYDYRDNSGKEQKLIITQDGIYQFPICYNTETGDGTFTGLFNRTNSAVTIEQIPSYQGAFVTDGVDDLITSTKTVQEMGITDEITVVSMIGQLSTPNVNNYTNTIRNQLGTTGSYNKVSAIDKTGIYGYSFDSSLKCSIINDILGDKQDYSVSAATQVENIGAKYLVQGWIDINGLARELSSVAWYWTVIANKVLTTDQINQVIAYYNLDRCVEPTVLYDVKRQGLSNDTPDSDWYLKDFSKNGFDMSLFNFAKKGNSGIGKYETDLSDTRIWTQSKNVTSSPLNSSYNGLSGWIIFANTELTNSADMPSFKIQVKGLLEGQELIYRYYDSTGQTNVYSMTKDGEYTLPADVRTAKPLTSNTSGFQVVKNDTNSITITQIPSHAGALCFDGVEDYGKVTGLPIYKDYTAIVCREFISDKTAPILSKAKEPNNGAFVVEIIANPDLGSTALYSFGKDTPNIDIIQSKSISYQTKYIYNSKDIVPGDGVDFDTMWIGKLRDNHTWFANAAIYSLMTFPYSMSEFLIERQLKKHKLGTLYPDMVEWRPIYTSNVNDYTITKATYFGETGQHDLALGNHYPIGTRFRIYVKPSGAVDEVTSIKVNGVEFTYDYIDSNYGYAFNGTLSSKSPQKIDITINEYIRYEDIVQPYPAFYEFTDEDKNLVTWGSKIKVGTTITRTKAFVDSNLLKDLYTISYPKLNGIASASSKCVVKKQMVFTCDATYIKGGNAPKCILSPSRLRIPNSSYKILGYIPDISGHGNHGKINNSAYAEGSGVNADGSYQLDGVDDFITIPTLSNSGKQILMKINWNTEGYNKFIADFRGVDGDRYYIVNELGPTVSNLAYQNVNKTYIDGIFNNNIKGLDLKGITHNITSQLASVNSSPYIGARTGNGDNLTMALYDFMLFDEISTDEEILTLNEYVGIEGNTDDLFTENN